MDGKDLVRFIARLQHLTASGRLQWDEKDRSEYDSARSFQTVHGNAKIVVEREEVHDEIEEKRGLQFRSTVKKIYRPEYKITIAHPEARYPLIREGVSGLNALYDAIELKGSNFDKVFEDFMDDEYAP